MNPLKQNIELRFYNWVNCSGAMVYFPFYCFLFFLPLYEAPKNIFAVLFVVAGVLSLIKTRKPFFQSGSVDFIIISLVLIFFSVFIAGMKSEYLLFEERIRSALNWSLLPLVPLIYIFLRPSYTVLLNTLIIVCISLSIGIIESLSSWSGEYPEINSVGHVNQSALYTTFGAFAVFMLMQSKLPIALKVLLCGGSVLLILYYQALARSMVASIGLLFLFTSAFILFLLLEKNKWLRLIYIPGVTFLALGVVFVSADLPIIDRFKEEIREHLTADDSHFSHRETLVYTATIFGDTWFGHGVSSYGKVITKENLKRKLGLSEDQWTAVKHRYYISNHGHNLFATVLVERGWVGVFSFVGMFFMIIREFFNRRKQFFENFTDGMMLISLVLLLSLAQTTLHVEHGALVFVLLGLLSAHQKKNCNETTSVTLSRDLVVPHSLSKR